MKRLVELIFDVNQNFYHASSIYAGLDILTRRGTIELRLRHRSRQEQHLTEDSLTVCLQLHELGVSRPKLIAIDLHDQSHVFAIRVLECCDGYLKRSFHCPDIAKLPLELARKVRPFGLNYGCRTQGSAQRLFRSAISKLMLHGITSFSRSRQYLSLPEVAEFEQKPTDAVEPTIVFQTRVWESQDMAPEEGEIINEGRVAIIRALRETFGDQFRGGLVPTPLALARYPREVSVYPSRRRLYTEMSKRNLIGIYTGGLHSSTAFKLAEYLAASQCIVAEPPRNQLPAPLVAGCHFLPFHNAEECVAACQLILRDNQLANQMRKVNHDYYKSEVEPASHMSHVLEFCGQNAFQ